LSALYFFDIDNELFVFSLTINDPVFQLWLKKNDYKILTAARY